MKLDVGAGSGDQIPPVLTPGMIRGAASGLYRLSYVRGDGPFLVVHVIILLLH